MEKTALTLSSCAKRKHDSTENGDNPPPPPSKIEGPLFAAGYPSGFSVLGGLPSGAIQRLEDFQSRKERASLRLTSRSFCDEVEIFCKKALSRLKTKHRVDDTFDDRIRVQTELETTRSKPLHLPFFYLIWKAMRTHLYTLESPQGNISCCDDLRLFETEDRIALRTFGVNHSQIHVCGTLNHSNCFKTSNAMVVLVYFSSAI